MQASEFASYINKFVANPGSNDAQGYGVVITRPAASKWRASVHVLTGKENMGGHNVYVDVRRKNGKRAMGAIVAWDWVGRQASQAAALLMIDKPDYDMADLPMYSMDHVLSVWVSSVDGKSVVSDIVSNLTTGHPNEDSFGGNYSGHFSFLVVIVEAEAGGVQPPVEVDVVGKLKVIRGNLIARQYEIADGITSLVGQIDEVIAVLKK